MADSKKTAENYSTGEKLALKGVPWPVAKLMADEVVRQQSMADATAAKTETKDEPTE